MGKNLKKRNRLHNYSYLRSGGTVYIELRDEYMAKLDSFKFGINDKALGNRVLLTIAEKYGFFMPTIKRPIEQEEEEEEEEQESLFSTAQVQPLISPDEGQKNKEFLERVEQKIVDSLKKKKETDFK